jgi:hypothetical protein
MVSAMNISARSLVLFLMLGTSACVVSQRAAPPGAYPQETTVSFQLFYDQMSPYGSWVEYQNYGYVWIPDVDRDFSPYCTNGHWVYTDYGWTWASDYPWGWAAFHYGRWAYDDQIGWLWIPGNDWGPAWVTWRRSQGYYGWAPMGPGVSVEVSFGRGYRVPPEHWTFINERDIDRSDIDRRYVDRSTNVTIINNTTVINTTHIDESRHTTYVAGPDRAEVERVTSKAVRPIPVRENGSPGQSLSNDQLRIYRPQVRPADREDRRVAPSRLKDLRDVRHNGDRNPGGRRREDHNPADNSRSGEGAQQSPTPAPPASREGGDPRRELSPPRKDRSNELPPERKIVTPPEPQKQEPQPPVVTPPEKKKVEDQQPEIQKERPTDSKGREQPWIGTPPERRRATDQPSPPRNARPPDVKSQQPPQVSTPPNGRGGRGRTPQPGRPNQPRKNVKKPPEVEKKPAEPQKDEKKEKEPPPR